jgi:hypothetical protein
LLELGQELLRIGAGANFRLHNQILPGKERQNAAQLHLRSAIAAGSFDVVDPHFQGPANRRLQVLLACRWDP